MHLNYTFMSPRGAGIETSVWHTLPMLTRIYHAQEFDAFFKATDRWHLTPAERRALLGVSSEERWLHCLHDAIQISPQELARVRAVIQIMRLLRCA